MRLLITIFILALPLPALAQMQEADKPSLIAPEIAASLVLRHARIGRIQLDAENVFDPSQPEEDKRLYKVANRLHITTRENILREILLFKTGDLYDPELLLESERVIRGRGAIADAFIIPSSYDEASNTVDILVFARDAWSLSTNFSFGRSGGQNHTGFGFEEGNLFGTGMRLNLLHDSSVDRDKNVIGFGDDTLFGSWVRLDAGYATASDGSSRNRTLGRPFYALDTRWSLDSAFLQEDRVDQVYDLGESIESFRHQLRTATIAGGWSKGNTEGRVTRWLVGITADRHTFLPVDDSPAPSLLPEDRQLVYPWAGVQLIGNDFHQFVELNDMGRIEDVQLGLSLTARRSKGRCSWRASTPWQRTISMSTSRSCSAGTAACAAFVDAGRTWGTDPRTSPSLGMLYDIGFGLRLSSPRASSGSVVHIDFAVPLNGPSSISGRQVNVKTKASF